LVACPRVELSISSLHACLTLACVLGTLGNSGFSSKGMGGGTQRQRSAGSETFPLPPPNTLCDMGKNRLCGCPKEIGTCRRREGLPSSRQSETNKSFEVADRMEILGSGFDSPGDCQPRRGWSIALRQPDGTPTTERRRNHTRLSTFLVLFGLTFRGPDFVTRLAFQTRRAKAPFDTPGRPAAEGRGWVNNRGKLRVGPYITLNQG